MLNFAKVAAALLVLLALALGIYAWTLARRPAAAPTTPVTAVPVPATSPSALSAVVVATHPVPAGQAVKAEDLRIEALPIDPPGAFRTVEPIVGQIPIFDLGVGTPVLHQQLASGLSTRIPEGERAVAVKVDESSAAGHRVRPGDLVDVFFLLRRDGNGEIDRSQARLLLARKRVLAYGSSSLDGLSGAEASTTPTGTASANASAQARNDPARTAVLSIPVAEINRLVLGEAHGRLLLALRNPNDTALPDPALQADLPPAMVHVKTRNPRVPPGLEGAHAGLALDDLSTGGNATQRPRNAAMATPHAILPAGSATRQAAEGTAVDFIRGGKRETLHY